jgi:hypothetical protein
MNTIRRAALAIGVTAFAVLVSIAASPLAAFAEGDWS